MKNKKITMIIISVIALMIVIFGVTYAYWVVTKSQKNQNLITAACIQFELSGESNDIQLLDQFPLSDADGLKLTPYEFTITNNCATELDFQIALESIGTASTTVSQSALKVALYEKETELSKITPRLLSSFSTVDPTVSNAFTANKLLNGYLEGKSNSSTKDVKTYNLLIWVDENAPVTESNKTFKSKITVSAGVGIVTAKNPYKSGTLAYKIIDNYGIENIVSLDGTDAFSKITTADEAGLYITSEGDGTSYYFRGAPTDNYVKFEVPDAYCPYGNCPTYGEYETETSCNEEAENGAPWSVGDCELIGNRSMYWRIVRINADGTIRLAYDGNQAVDNGVAHNVATENHSGEYDIYYNHYSNVTYDEVFDDSEIANLNFYNGSDYSAYSQLSYYWYDTHLSNFSKYLSSSTFCSDMDVYTTSQYEDHYCSSSSNGLCTNKHFNAYDRLYNKKEPKLLCTEKSSIGLLTADEIAFAGAVYGQNNKTFYLYTGSEFWTMTPHNFDNNPYSGASVFTYGSSLSSNQINYTLVSRPVINLKAGITYTGEGTKDNPYVFN